MISFVDYLVGLDIKSPVKILRKMIDCFVGFGCKNASAFTERIIPNAVDNFNLSRVDTAYKIAGIVIRVPDNCNELIAERKYGRNCFCDGIIILYCIPDKSKTAD